MQKNLFIQQLEQIRQFVADCDRKVSVNKRRLEETQDQESLGPEALAVHQLNEQIGVKLAEAEDLGKKFVQWKWQRGVNRYPPPSPAVP